MENNVKVSIIIPVYNTESYLKECLDSLINQTLRDIEIICVDDGSTDTSLEILRSYEQKDPRVRVLTSEHKRQGYARNLGIASAKGKYIGFVDSDDWAELDMFEKLYNRAEETRSDITMCPTISYNENLKESSRENTYSNLSLFDDYFFENVFSPEETYEFILDICVYPCNKLFNREFWQKNNLSFPVNIFYEDGILFLDAWLKAKRISLIRDFCYYYRIFAKNSTCYHNDMNKIDGIWSLKHKENALRKNGVYDLLKEDFRDFQRYSLMYWFYQIKDPKVKILYTILMFFKMPVCILEPIYSAFKELELYSKIHFLGKKRIVLWGASIFLEKVVKKYKISTNKIIGIVDKNPEKTGTYIGKYECFLPEDLEKLNPDEVIISIINFAKENRELIRKYLINNGFEHVKLSAIANRYNVKKKQKKGNNESRKTISKKN